MNTVENEKPGGKRTGVEVGVHGRGLGSVGSFDLGARDGNADDRCVQANDGKHDLQAKPTPVPQNIEGVSAGKAAREHARKEQTLVAQSTRNIRPLPGEPGEQSNSH